MCLCFITLQCLFSEYSLFYEPCLMFFFFFCVFECLTCPPNISVFSWHLKWRCSITPTLFLCFSFYVILFYLNEQEVQLVDMNSYQGCKNVQHCHWDMWTDCIIIQQRVYDVFVCVLSRKTCCCSYYKRCSYVFDFELYVVHGDYSNKHKLGRGFVVVVDHVVPNSYDLLSSLVLKKTKHKLKIFGFNEI